MAKRPGGVMLQSPTPTKSQLIPVLTKWEEIGKKSQLGPIIVTLVAFFGIQFTRSDPPFHMSGVESWKYGWTSNCLIILGLYLTLVSLYFIYRLVGKNKAWWALFLVFAATAYCLWLLQTQGTFGWMYEFFHNTLAGGEPDDRLPFLQLFFRHFLGTGFFEETFKAMPLFALVLLGRYMPDNLRAKIGIEEPLDGILLGAAAGAGFAVLETLIQYVSRGMAMQWIMASLVWLHNMNSQQIQAWLQAHLIIMNDPRVPQQVRTRAFQELLEVLAQGRNMLGYAPGVVTLIYRSIDLAFGHMAYSGYFGYFIGLSVLKPEKRWKILLIGLVSASIPHALWDSIDSEVLSALVAVGSYAVLAAAILKAREISPNRAVLQPSVVFGSMVPSPVAAQASWPVPQAAAAAVAAPAVIAIPPPPPNIPAGTPSLRIGARYLVIVPGLRLLEHQVPGLHPQTPGDAVAEVTRNPNDPSVLGLTNRSTSAWEVVTATGNRRDIQPGGTVKLASGTKIDFGSTDGEVR